MHMKKSVILIAVLLVGASAWAATGTADKKADAWEKDMAAFAEKDRQQPPPQDAILFVGSSTIRIWDLKKCFPELVTINRGFGGSQYADSARYADRIIVPYKPKRIVIYGGDNDIASGKTPEQVFADFEALIKAIRKGLPDTPIIVLSIKPSIARWDKYMLMQQVNASITGFAQKNANVKFVDLGRELLGGDQKPLADLFQKDGLHMNDKGYAIWSDLLRPILK
jgi:lysophospholipase L1-like esterase